jgi:predicted Zn-dependent protease
MSRTAPSTALLCRVFCFLALTVFCVSAAEKGAADNSAAVVAVEGSAELGQKEPPVWTALKEGAILQPGDQVRTARKSRVTIRLSDASILRIGESTFFRLIPVADPKQKRIVDIRQGSTYFFSRERPAEIHFTTPTVSGAIRGTEFVVVADDQKSTVALLDGEISLQNEAGDLSLGKNELATIEKGKAPSKSPLINATAAIQWVLYYPAVLNPIELTLSEEEQRRLASSIANYMAGDIAAAREQMPEAANLSEMGLLYRAALDLTLGQVDQVKGQISSLSQTNELARSLDVLIAAVTGTQTNILGNPSTASLALANSYYLQSRGEVKSALQAAEAAVRIAPHFGHAWIRLAELQLQLGRIGDAKKSIEKGLQIAPQHAYGYAIQGHILAAEFKSKSALASFQKAIDLDAELSYAWAGRALEKIRTGDLESGLKDLQTAASLEPQRSIFHSYLIKVYAAQHSFPLANKESARAKALDSGDPTSWLYSGLNNYLQNNLNTAIRDIEKSLSLNHNELLFKSPYQLDQDRAAKTANLAAVFRDVSMSDFALHEASKAVSVDYSSYASHLFLSQSYDVLRDPKKFNLRYETPRISELLLANLLSPPGGHNLSINQSQNDVPELFERNALGISSETQYTSNGDWVQYGSQFGTIKSFGYSVDAFYHDSNGQRVNEDFNQLTLSASAKEQISYQDSLFVQAISSRQKGGDLSQYYSPEEANPSIRIKDEIEPLMYMGYHREWQPGSHTLLLAGYFDSELTITNGNALPLFLRPAPNGQIVRAESLPLFSSDYDRQFEGFSLEGQQIWQNERFGVIAGTRFQAADLSVHSDLDRVLSGRLASDNVGPNFMRISPYLYGQWRPFERLQLTGGASYDYIEYPENIDIAPLSGEEKTRDAVLPKAGALFNTWEGGTLRGMYAHSLAGLSYDTSIRIEPTQLGGFTQAYRSLAPESVVGIQPGTLLKIAGAGFDQKLKTDTYFTIEVQNLRSDDSRSIGAFRTANPPPPVPNVPSITDQRISYEEDTLRVQFSQLLGKYWHIGTSYQVSSADLLTTLTEAPSAPGAIHDEKSTFHQLDLFTGFNHTSGFFAQYDAIWYNQSVSSNVRLFPGEDFWHHNVSVGYRFPGRQAELRLSLLNLFNQDYKLYPLNLYNDPPRDRLLTVGFKWRY